jgi:hypothetical protein
MVNRWDRGVHRSAGNCDATLNRQKIKPFRILTGRAFHLQPPSSEREGGYAASYRNLYIQSGVMLKKKELSSWN